MKTAIEFLFEEMNRIRLEDESGNIGAIEFFQLQKNAYEKAKEMEQKERIVNNHLNNNFKRTLKRLIIIADRYEKERQGLYVDELVYLSDAKFILNSFEKN